MFVCHKQAHGFYLNQMMVRGFSSVRETVIGICTPLFLLLLLGLNLPSNDPVSNPLIK